MRSPFVELADVCSRFSRGELVEDLEARGTSPTQGRTVGNRFDHAPEHSFAPRASTPSPSLGSAHESDMASVSTLEPEDAMETLSEPASVQAQVHALDDTL